VSGCGWRSWRYATVRAASAMQETPPLAEPVMAPDAPQLVATEMPSGVPCDRCAHAAVCSLKPLVALFVDHVTHETPPALHIASLSLDCDHFLEVVL
jgi:hypothetical protein